MEEDAAVPVERTDAAGAVRRAGQEAELARPIRLGDKVRLKSLGTQGIVSALGEEEAEVQIGVMRVRTRLVELERMGGAPVEEKKPQPSGITASMPPAPGIELDLRGLRAEEASDRLTDYLDSAYLNQMPFVRIIHGKGTGKLREVVHKALKASAHVSSFELGKDGEGGEGVTVVKFNP